MRGFARQVEQFLDRMNAGATAPGDSREAPVQERANTDVSLGYVPGASASSSTGPPLLLRTPKPPTIPAPPQFLKMRLPNQGRMLRHLDKVRVALRTLAQCEVKSVLAPLG